jgi:hypothetical protein
VPEALIAMQLGAVTAGIPPSVADAVHTDYAEVFEETHLTGN